MNNNRLLWVNHVHAAALDLNAALHDEESNAAAHLRDAIRNAERALEVMEEEEA